MVGTGLGAPRARDLLLELDHSDVPLALVVVERDVEVDGEAEHLVSVGVEAPEQVDGGVVVPLASGSRDRSVVDAPALGDEFAVADPDGVQRGGVEARATLFDGLFSLAPSRSPIISSAQSWSKRSNTPWSSRR